MSHTAGLGMLIFLYHVIILFIWTFLELAYYFLSCNSKLRATINGKRSLTDWVHNFITEIQKLKLFDMEIEHQEKHAHSFSPPRQLKNPQGSENRENAIILV